MKSFLLGLLAALLAQFAPSLYLALLALVTLGIVAAAVCFFGIVAWCLAGDPANRDLESA